MASVTLEQVRKVYTGGVVAVAGADFSVADGELLVLVGPSGCGKTTTLRMIAGLETITSGTLKIGDRIVNDVEPKDRDIAMVFQNYALYPHMTVAENLGFGLKLRGESREEIAKRVKESADLLELGPYLDRLPRALSGGQRQRVALGRALVRSPQVYLLDEPLSNLDAKLRLSTRQEIARLHRRVQTTMIYVTHDQIEAMTLGQRIVVFKSGEIQQIDTPMNLYRKPANAFVAGFLGSPAMNLFRGKVIRGDGLQLKVDEATLPLGTISGLETWIDQDLIVGVRPEDLKPAAGEPLHFTAQLDVIEPVGNEVFLHLNWNRNEVVVRAALTELPERGTSLTLGYTPSKLHFFDAQTERRIDIA
jgi:multiple sugar transport system ATP-binding protein